MSPCTSHPPGTSASSAVVPGPPRWYPSSALHPSAASRLTWCTGVRHTCLGTFVRLSGIWRTCTAGCFPAPTMSVLLVLIGYTEWLVFRVCTGYGYYLSIVSAPLLPTTCQLTPASAVILGIATRSVCISFYIAVFMSPKWRALRSIASQAIHLSPRSHSSLFGLQRPRGHVRAQALHTRAKFATILAGRLAHARTAGYRARSRSRRRGDPEESA